MKFLVLFLNILLFLIGLGISNILVSSGAFTEVKTENEIIENAFKELKNPPQNTIDYKAEKRKRSLLLIFLLFISTLAIQNFCYLDNRLECSMKKKILYSLGISTICVLVFYGIILLVFQKIESGLVYLPLYLSIGLFLVPVIVKEFVGFDNE